MFENFHEAINNVLVKKGISKSFEILKPPTRNFGDFCIVINQIAGKKDPLILGEELINEFSTLDHIESISLSTIKSKKTKGGIVYLNFTISENVKQKLQCKFIESAIKQVFSTEYGQLEMNKGKIALIEHTSANPISPLHVGNLRNSIQGDTFARILKQTGYKVYRHFYVNDVGLQVSYVIIGYEILKEQNIKPPIKIDLWLGQIYAIMNNFYSIQSIKENVVNIGITPEKYILTSEDHTSIHNWMLKQKEKIQSEYDEFLKFDTLDNTQKKKFRELKHQITKKNKEIENLNKVYFVNISLKRRFPQIYNQLYSGITEINLHEKTALYLLAYEKNTSSSITLLFREVVQWIISAFQWTLKRYNIDFDQFDYESEITSSGLPDDIINKLSKSPNTIPLEGKGVRYSYPEPAINEFCNALGISKKDLPIKGIIPDLQLRRSDGTALYGAKDIAYSISKYNKRKPDIIYNVISTEQILSQFQLLLPIYELGMPELAKNLKHYSYERVELYGRLMSGRLAIYVTADEFYDETIIRARMAKRASDHLRGRPLPQSDAEWKQESDILRSVALASTRFPLIETSPNRKIELDLDRELDFKRNSGPFVQYAHARASNVIIKVKNKLKSDFTLNINFSLVTSDEIIEIIQHLQELNMKILDAANTQDPSLIANWCFKLAHMFMKFYEKNPVLHAENEELMQARFTIVNAIQKGISTGLNILGIPPAERI